MSASSSVPSFAFDLALPVRTKAIPVPAKQPRRNALHRVTDPFTAVIATCIGFARWS